MNVRREERSIPRYLQDGALLLLVLKRSWLWAQNSTASLSVFTLRITLSTVRQELNIPNRLIKNTLQVPLGQRRALKVLVRLDVLSTSKRLVVGYWFHALLAEGLEGCWVVAEIEFGADEDDGNVWGVVLDLREPLGAVLATALGTGGVGTEVLGERK